MAHASACPCLVCVSNRSVIVIEDDAASPASLPAPAASATPVVLPTVAPLVTPVVPSAVVLAMTMQRDEEKHWSKAMTAVLRHELGRATNRTLPVATLLAVVHTSHRFGTLTIDKLTFVAMRSHRLNHFWETDVTTGFFSEMIHAV